METPYDEQIEDLLRDYQEQRRQLGELQRRTDEVTVTVTAPRQVVKVTVGPQGRLLALEFPSTAYRRLAPAELAQILTATIQQAGDRAIAEVAGLLSGLLPPGLDAEEILHGRADLTAFLPEDPHVPTTVRAYVASGRVGGTGDADRD
ncbi:YbaB/EbfC family nucleoid-associated protein [Streptomyces sp. NPDC096068]|uniref:YbaB/EbfC family nucleoid-associated protein n=1 Tax=Streptomyces sp. NPDC096068 TaxID=3155424 RepID=UPI003321E926